MSSRHINNTYVRFLRETTDPVASAMLTLAEQQRQRNVLAALTAHKRGLAIPEDCQHLLDSLEKKDKQ